MLALNGLDEALRMEGDCSRLMLALSPLLPPLFSPSLSWLLALGGKLLGGRPTPPRRILIQFIVFQYKGMMMRCYRDERRDKTVHRAGESAASVLLNFSSVSSEQGTTVQ